MAVLLETSLGDIVVDLYVEERPKCSINFLKLCKVKFYNYSLFFNVQRNFTAQAGDPLATGKGGQSIWGLLQGEEYR
jgi:peptidyl-prolyl cis-trans isomerase-like 4